MKHTVCRIAGALLPALAFLLVAASPSGAQTLDRKALSSKRGAMIDWASRNGVVIKGMTKAEVHKVYGFPDKKYTTMTSTGPVEKWSYYYPRRRSIFPFTRSAFASRYRYLYFRDDVLINMEM